jgi:DNA-binding NtrC family response regulator
MKISECTILVAEDDPASRQLYYDVLTREGYRVLTAVNGIQALAELKDEKVHLLVTDLKMPDMSALEMLPEIRKNQPELPVIVVSAYYRQMQEEFHNKGFEVHFFNKPLNLNVLKAKIVEILNIEKTPPSATGEA